MPSNDEVDTGFKLPLKSYPARDSLCAETDSDVDDHVSARTAFLNELVADERTGQLFDAWRTACGLNIAALQERAAADPDRAADEFADSFDANIDQLSRRALAFVRDDLRLPWAWVIFEVLEAFACDSVAKIFGIGVEKSIQRQSPPIKVAFRSRAHEAAEEIRARLLAELEPVLASLCGATRRPDSVKRDERIEKWVTWFYRQRIRGESVRAIAKDYRTADDRPTIRRGIVQAARLLALGAYCIQLPPGEITRD
jgi:hypothetical protein